MAHSKDLSLTPLARHALLKLPRGAGHAVAVGGGCVWITEDGDPQDKVLGPGESIVLRGARLAIVQALEDSQVMVFDPHGRAATGDAPPAAETRPVHHERAYYERQARALRQQAIADAMHGLMRLVQRTFGRLGRTAGA